MRFPGLVGQLEKILLSPKRVRRISADTLTNNLNTIQITKVKDIRVGDLIRLTHENWSGKHIAVIVSVSQKKLIYAHSSDATNMTQAEGPHLGEIIITNPNKDLDQQKWLEKTRDGDNYGKRCYRSEIGDSVRRLLFIEG